MNKLTIFVLIAIYFEVSYCRYTYEQSSDDELENILAKYTNAVDSAPKAVRRRLSRPVSLRRPPPRDLQPKKKPPKSAPPKTTYPIPAPESKKYPIDDKILITRDGKIIEGSADGTIKIDGIVAYNDEKLKKGLVRVENIDGDLCVNGNVVMKRDPSKPKIRLPKPKIDTDQVQWFRIKVVKPGGNVNYNSNNFNGNNFSGIIFNGGVMNFNSDSYSIYYQDNINGNMMTS